MVKLYHVKKQISLKLALFDIPILVWIHVIMNLKTHGYIESNGDLLRKKRMYSYEHPNGPLPLTLDVDSTGI